MKRSMIFSSELLNKITERLKNKEKRIKKMEKEISNLKTMQKRVAQLESLLSNLALKTEETQKQKVSLNEK